MSLPLMCVIPGTSGRSPGSVAVVVVPFECPRCGDASAKIDAVAVAEAVQRFVAQMMPAAGSKCSCVPSSAAAAFNPEVPLSVSIPGQGSSSFEEWPSLVKPVRECKFCKSSGEAAEVFASHMLRCPVTQRLLCPVLRKRVCDKCGATGDDAHTRNYCPLMTSREKIERSLPFLAGPGPGQSSRRLKKTIR